MTIIPEISARESLILFQIPVTSALSGREGENSSSLSAPRPYETYPFHLQSFVHILSQSQCPILKQESFLFLSYGIDVVSWYGISSHNHLNIACRSQEIFPFTTLSSNDLHHIACADVTALFISTWFQLSTIAESVVAIFDSLNKEVRITDILVFRSVGQTVGILLS